MSAGLRPAVLFPWFAPISSLKGVGPAVATALARLLKPIRPLEDDKKHVPVLRDLLFHLPHGVIDRRNIVPVATLVQGQYATVEVEITDHTAPPRIKRPLPYKVSARDATGFLTLTFFHVKGDYLSRTLPVGSKRLICGTVDMYDGRPSMAHPDVIAAPDKAEEVARLVPSYALTAHVSQKLLSRLTEQALRQVSILPEWIGEALLKERRWPSQSQALQALHRPENHEAIDPASHVRARLAYDELLANQLALSLSRRFEQKQQSYAIAENVAMQAQLLQALPFTLTAGQRDIIKTMQQDMLAGQRMIRLLQGDVGSGKTMVAFALMSQVAAAGYQACLMAPTDLLARQHFKTLGPIAEKLGLKLILLSGKMRKNEREVNREKIASGEAQLVVGTHALFQEGVAFMELALVVVDEQHRFGVAQRMKLTGKGRSPHLLQMTATPIPRSLCMTLYGDMEVSSLTERPPGRKEIDTRAVPSARMAEVIDGLQRVLDAGEKVYWVCPLIVAPTEDEKDIAKRDLAAAEERYKMLAERFPGKVGLVHGRMKPLEREKVMQDFAAGDIHLLVATTVVEVGVDVPQATVMVIEHAERFGLAQLHQLRGRVGRNDKTSRCILLYHDKLSETAKARLKILRETNDGFVIAEEDLRLRGAGDVFGTRQTGLPDFVLADMGQHLGLIRIAHDDAAHALHQDPDLMSPRGQALRLLMMLFEYDAAFAPLKSV